MRRICFCLTYRGHYARLKKLIRMVADDPEFELQIIAAGSVCLERFKRPVDIIRRDGYRVDSEIYFDVEGSTPQTMAKSLGLATIEFANEFARLQPEFVVLMGDRFEAVAAGLAAATMNHCLIHFQGGEVSGSIDESYRHCLTKLSHYHVPATERAKENLIRMGEREHTILTVGCPGSDIAREIVPKPNGKLMVVYHPMTTALYQSSTEINSILGAIEQLKMPTLLFWPNVDAGSDAISKLIRVWRDRVKPGYVEYVRNMEPEAYQQALADAACCLGNSSSFARDASFFGTPCIMIGDRQFGRDLLPNMTTCPIQDVLGITRAYKRATARTRKPIITYGDGHVSERVHAALKRIEPYSQKRLAC